MANLRLAAMDLGSNSFHLLVVEAHPDGTFEPIVREKEMLRIGDVVSREGRVSDSAAARLIESIGRLRTLAESAGATEIVACATSALREADNSAEIVDRIEAETGVRVEVISGKDEARLIFGAIRASVVIDEPPALCLDLGGGSLEVMVGDNAGLLWSTSVHLGVARLTAELVRHDPPDADDLRRLRRRVTSVLAPLADEVADLSPRTLVGTSGTLCDLARMAAAHRAARTTGREGAVVPASINQLRVRRRDILAVHERILALPAAARQRLPGLEARRGDIVPAGSVLLVTAMELFGLDHLVVGEWALREGIVLDAIGHHEPADFSSDPRAIRLGSVVSLCRRCNADDGHSQLVARLATDLFDQTLRLHRLRIDDRELLEFGGLLHDVGEHVSVDAHHKHSAYLIEHGRLRGFSPEEVAMLASLGRFHRRGDPKMSFEPFGQLSGGAQERVTKLTALLRVADGLDRGHSGVVDAIDVDVLPDRVRLTVYAAGDADLELWGVRRKRDLFERVFDRRLEIQLAGSRNGAMAPDQAEDDDDTGPRGGAASAGSAGS
jgi:exopolyphosphatase/guanosine-5'-triphosphate,3'-diphosphate pyrophosphatase